MLCSKFLLSFGFHVFVFGPRNNPPATPAGGNSHSQMSHFVDYFPNSRAATCAVHVLATSLIFAVVYVCLYHPLDLLDTPIRRFFPSALCGDKTTVQLAEQYANPIAVYWMVVSPLFLLLDLQFCDINNTGECNGALKFYTRVSRTDFWSKYQLAIVLACINTLVAGIFSLAVTQPLSCWRTNHSPRLSYYEQPSDRSSNRSGNGTAPVGNAWAAALNDINSVDSFTVELVVRAALVIAILSLCADSWFFVSHRIFHIPFLYEKIHKLHHVFKQSVAANSIACYPIEHVISNNLTAEIGGLVLSLPMNFNTLWITFETVVTLLTHSGYRIPMVTKWHDAHHRLTMVEFGTALVCDRAAGTDLDTYEQSHLQQRKSETVGRKRKNGGGGSGSNKLSTSSARPE